MDVTVYLEFVIQSLNHDVQRKPTEHHASAEASGETKRHIPVKGCVFVIFDRKSPCCL